MRYLALWTALSGICGLTLISPVQAQSCATYGNYRTYRPTVTYSVPTYSYVAPTYSYVAPSYVAPTHVTPYVAPVVKKVVEHKDEYTYLKFIAVVPLVEMPTYSAVYTPPYAPVQNAQTKQDSDQLKQILELLKSYETRFKALEARQSSSLPQQATPQALQAPQTPREAETPKIPDVRAVNAQKCALCHQRGNEAAGGRFVLSEANGNIVRLNAEQLGEVDEKIKTNAMPPKSAKAKSANITELTEPEYVAWQQEISRQRVLNKEGKK